MFFFHKISAQLSHALGGFLERLAKEIKRRTKVVAAFCKEDTVEKLLYLLGEAGEHAGSEDSRKFR
jgi:transposase-like protein